MYKFTGGRAATALLPAFLVLQACNVHYDASTVEIRDLEITRDAEADAPMSDMNLDTTIGSDSGSDFGRDLDVSDASDAEPRDASDLSMDVALDTGGDVGDDMDLADLPPNPCSSLSPIAYWPLDAYSVGTVFDDQSGNNDIPSAIASESLPLIAGYSGNTPVFDGVDDFIGIQHSPAFLLEQGSVSFWIRPGDMTLAAGLFSKDASGTEVGGHYSISMATDGTVDVRLQDTTGSFVINSSQTAQEGQWNHVVGTFGPNGMELYLNRILQGTNPHDKGLYDPASTGTETIKNEEPIALGGGTNGSTAGTLFPMNRHFFGELDEVAIFDRQLTAAEINDLADPNCSLAP